MHCIGRIVLGEDLNALRHALESHLDQDTVALDLAQVNAIDAAGLGLLMLLLEEARTSQREFRLLNSSRHVLEALAAVNLLSVFGLPPTEGQVQRVA
ncbi:MAG: STAS domain-containing protein [Acidobacteria bacterium]|nr:STAS domain-containing protein [Acidobacteriota bacterium]